MDMQVRKATPEENAAWFRGGIIMCGMRPPKNLGEKSTAKPMEPSTPPASEAPPPDTPASTSDAADEPILEFEEDSLRGELFSFAEIPEFWNEGDYICMLDHNEILEVLNETADFVDEDLFEDGMPGMSGAYYKVYADDVESFRQKLTTGLLTLLENTYGPDGEEDR
jgi:hypothetical protein